MSSLGGRCPKKLRRRFVFGRAWSRGLELWLGGLPVEAEGRWKEVGRSPKKPSNLLVLVRPRELFSLRSVIALSCAAAACSLAIACARRNSAPPGLEFRFVKIRRSLSGNEGSWQYCSNSPSVNRVSIVRLSTNRCGGYYIHLGLWWQRYTNLPDRLEYWTFWGLC